MCVCTENYNCLRVLNKAFSGKPISCLGVDENAVC